MDSLTHVAVGACLGELLLGKNLGKKAILLGIAAQCFPDIDGLASLWLSPTENLIYHRGITHSIFFHLFAALFFAFVIKKAFPRWGLSFPKFFVFLLLQFAIHSLLDTFNSYGTGLLVPFSDMRFSLNLLFVADPIFSLPLVIATIALVVSKSNHKQRSYYAFIGLLIPFVYLSFVVFNKFNVNNLAIKSLQSKSIRFKSLTSYPTSFNSMLWYIVAQDEAGYHIGYRSIFDPQHYPTPFTYYAQNKALLALTPQSPELENLISFSQNGYTIEKKNDLMTFNIVRFGRIAGWESDTTEFTFQYALNDDTKNELLVQRGRIKEWNLATYNGMLRRIKGIN